MNIRDLTNTAPLGRSLSESAVSGPGVRPAESAQVRPGAALAAESRGGRSAVVEDLRSRLQSTPDVREDVVAAARAAVESGELLTRDAALDAARGLIGPSAG